MNNDFKNEIFDIIIQGGQSNSEGCGIGHVNKPFKPRDEILMMDSEFNITTAHENFYEGQTIGNFSLTFADRYVDDGRLQKGHKLLILRAAVGGTGFCDRRWGLEDDLFLKMMDMIGKALSLNPANRAVAFVWHQGETDTSVPVYDTHYRNLSTLVNRVRQAAGCDDLPFIAGDFVKHWSRENADACKPIISAIRDVCANIGNAAFVETDGLQSNAENTGNDDTIHFCREALYQMGHRYYDAYLTLNNGSGRYPRTLDPSV